jgi:hypothetical protein
MDAASLRAFDERSALVGEGLWPSSVILAGLTYACTIVRPRQGIMLGPFAEEDEPVQLTVRIRKTLLSSPPAPNTFLTWEGKRWKIASILGQASAEAKWSLVCNPAP